MYKGESYGKLYALVDDTEHYSYMEELEKQKEIADSANEAKSRFLANMSHEIRTPINAVLGLDEMILRESGEKNIRAYAGDIMSAGRTLLSLINDILDLSKVEEGKMEIIPVRFDLSSLVNDLVHMIKDRADKKGLSFNVKADEHIPHLLTGDEIRIRQCAMNLLTNAVKYTEKGSVTLEVSYEKKDEGHISLMMTVTDTGIGMKEEDMQSLFSPYKRIEEKRNRAIEGTGLGMSITRQLLELMGSELKVHSEYGKGSVFSFAIDQEVAKWEELGDITRRFAGVHDPAYGYHELFHAPDARILVVDDTEMNLTVIKGLLKKTGIQIDTAMSGREAIGLTKQHDYDVLFIDHMMPDMDGIQTLKAIRESEKTKDVPAVALTANAVSGAREMYLEAGFTDYMSKPVDGEKLERLLAKLLPADKVIEAPEGGDARGKSTGGDNDPKESAQIASAEDGAGKENALEANAQSSSTQDEAADLIERIKRIPEIDLQAGLKNCGSEESFISVISVFHQTARVKADEIEDLLKNGDIANYTVKVHALKSSARIIGAKELSAAAAELEAAGERKDEEYIGAHTDEVIAAFRALDGKLKLLDPEEDELKDITPGVLKDAYQAIIETAGSMDYGMVEDIIKELKGYRLPEADRSRIGEIESRLTELDWDGMIADAGEGLTNESKL